MSINKNLSFRERSRQQREQIALAIKSEPQNNQITSKLGKKYGIKISHIPNLNICYFSANSNIPSMVDLRKNFPAAYDQGNLGSCTANAICGVISYENSNFMGSRLFLYYNEQKSENNFQDDAKTELSDGINVLANYGICPESMWSYNESKFATKPPNNCYDVASTNKFMKIKQITNDLKNMKTVLSYAYPFVVGIAIYESFESDQVAKTGVVSMPQIDETCLGGQTVVCVGYDDNRQVWIMRNSWGTNWGDNGYFYLPYKYLFNKILATDLWIIMK